MSLAPIIVLCENYKDLVECEEQTGVYYFTLDKDEDGNTMGKVSFPSVYFRFIDKESPDMTDYDLYEISVVKNKDRELFLKEYYYGTKKRFNLIEVKPSEIKETFPEYFI